MSAILAFMVAMVLTMALMPMLMRVAMRLGFVDMPAERKVHARPIPRIGGVAMACGLLLGVLLAGGLDRFSLAFLCGAGTLLLFGVLDDRLDLDYRLKFVGQLLAIGIVIFGGGVLVSGLTLADRVAVPMWVSIPLTGFFLLGVTNAMNLADGLDGLAGGMAFLCLGALGLLARSAGLIEMTAIALATAGAVLGFLRFNTFPASVFMGDAGSQLLGFTVGVLGVAVTQDATSIYSASLPLLLAGIPVLDTLSVIVQRLLERRSPFKADRNHLHHKLLGLGFDQRESVTLVYAAQIVLFVLAYAMRFESDLLILGTYAAFAATVLGTLQLARRCGWRLRMADGDAAKGPLSRAVEKLASPDRLVGWSTPALGAGLAAYALQLLLQVRAVPTDSLFLALALAGTLAITWVLMRQRSLHNLEKGAIYVAAALLVYLDTTLPATDRYLPGLDWLLPLWLALVTAFRLRMARDRRFQVTPLDLLIVFVALVVPSLPGLLSLPSGAPLGVAKIIVLFYSIELLAGGGQPLAPRVRLGSLLVLAGICLRSVLAGAP